MTHKKRRRGCMAGVLVLVFLALLGSVLYPLAKRLYPQRYAQFVEASAEEFGLDPLLVYAFVCTESGFDPMAESNVGARGLMQITNETYSWINSKLAPGTVENYDTMYNADDNIRYGCYYIAACMNRYRQDVSTTAAAYHSGWGTVDTLLQDEQYSEDGATLYAFPYHNMNRYVEKINRNYFIYQLLYKEK